MGRSVPYPNLNEAEYTMPSHELPDDEFVVPRPILSARDVSMVYGSGEAEVRALD